MRRSFLAYPVLFLAVFSPIVAVDAALPCDGFLERPDECQPDLPVYIHGGGTDHVSDPDPGYEFPDGLDIERLQIADERVRHGEGIHIEVNVTNTGDTLIVFEPPLFVYYETDEILLDVNHRLGLIVLPGETVHVEVAVFWPERPGEYHIGVDYEHERFPIGQAEVYKNKTSNVSTTATP